MKNKANVYLIIVWLIMITILSVDMITTAKGIKLGAYESSAFPAFLFNSGVGYIFVFIIEAFVILIILFLFFKFADWLFIKFIKRKMSYKLRIFLYCLIVISFTILEFFTIRHNIGVIRSLT